MLRRTGDEERPLVRASTTAMASPKIKWCWEKFPMHRHKRLSVKMAARASSMHCGSEAAHNLEIARLQQPPQMSLGTSLTRDALLGRGLLCGLLRCTLRHNAKTSRAGLDSARPRRVMKPNFGRFSPPHRTVARFSFVAVRVGGADDAVHGARGSQLGQRAVRQARPPQLLLGAGANGADVCILH